MEKCLLGKTEIFLPNILAEDLSVFLQVINAETWENEISENQKLHLMKFLPKFNDDVDAYAKADTLQKLFSGDNFKFGNPLVSFHNKLCEGRFAPEISRYTAMVKKAKYKEYLGRQKMYVSKLLKEVLVNRQRLLAAVSMAPPEANIKVEWWHSSEDRIGPQTSQQRRHLELTVCKRYKSEILEINKECGVPDTSSDEEDLLTECSRNPAYAEALKQLEAHSENESKTDSKGKSLKRQILPTPMDDDTFYAMLKKHKKRKIEGRNDPELITEGTTLEGVMARTYKRPVGRPPKPDKGKPVPKKRAKKNKIDGSMPALWSSPGEEGATDAVVMETKEETDEEVDMPPMYVSKQNYGQHACFFSLLRNFIVEEPEHTIATVKVEQKISDWQKSADAAKNDWLIARSSWLDVTSSALTFLAGDTVGVDIENFVPFVDFRERMTRWIWIGRGRDLDAQMLPLCAYWLKNFADTQASQRDAMSTPPPRFETDYVVIPAEDEDKEVFQEQELIRFENPHEAYTYFMHGYESVVGPVKGVYEKPWNEQVLKARDHTLLIKERPSYVTILTLVRDAAARLPNGIGTRADICELLKYSQYLTKDATDSLVHSVVSGALDRLQYEKDPCVKYKSSRKIWVYLHRNRNEDDFNKIHQTRGKAVKAKQALKPKVPRKHKDLVAFSQSLVRAVPADATHATVMSQVPENLRNLYQQQQNLYLQKQLGKHQTNQSSPQVITVNAATNSPCGVPVPAARVVEVGAQPSMSGLDILSSVAQAKIGGVGGSGNAAGDIPKTVIEAPTPQQLVRTKIVTPPTGRKRVSITRQSSESQSAVTSLLQSHLLATPSEQSNPVGVSVVQPKARTLQTPTASKPVALSLLQSSTVSKLLESQGAQIQKQPQNHPKTVVFGPKSGFKGQAVVTTLKQGQIIRNQALPQTSQIIASGSASSVHSAIHQVPASPSSVGSIMVSAANTPGARSVIMGTPQGSQSIVVSSAGSKPVLARLIEQTSGGQQVITLASGQKAVVSSGAKQQPAFVSMSGSPIVQTMVPGGSKQNKPIILQRVNPAELSRAGGTSPRIVQASPSAVSVASPQFAVAQKTTPPVSVTKPMTSNIIQVPASGKSSTIGGKPIIVGGKQLTISSVGGKPLTLGGKPVFVSSDKPTAQVTSNIVTLSGGKQVPAGKIVTLAGQSPQSTGGKPVQINRQTVQIGGKPFQISGKPVQIKGSPTSVGTKPVTVGFNQSQIRGQTVQVSSAPVQMGKPIQIGGKPVQMVGKPLQVGGKPLQIGGKPVQMGAKSVQIGGQQVQIGGKPVQISMIQGSQSQQPKQVITSIGSKTQQVVRAVSPASASGSTLPQSVVQQLIQSGQLKAVPGSTIKSVSGTALQNVLAGGQVVKAQPQIQNISQPKTVSLAGANIGTTGPRIVTVPQGGAQRIVVQSHASPIGTSVRAQQHIITGKRLSQASGGIVRQSAPGQNIQLVRTMLSPAASAGTTVMLAQPAAAKNSATIPAGQNVHTIVSANSGAAKAGSGQQVYARIINQPAGIRMATVRAASPQGQIRNIQGQSLSQSQLRALQSTGEQVHNVSGVNIQTVQTEQNENST